jgi:hypothetical protein
VADHEEIIRLPSTRHNNRAGWYNGRAEYANKKDTGAMFADRFMATAEILSGVQRYTSAFRKPMFQRKTCQSRFFPLRY